jgi:hypothetical protein
MGLDQCDLPLPYMAQQAKLHNDPTLFWQAHLVGRALQYCHLEPLVN